MNGTGKDFHGIAKDAAAAGNCAVAALCGSDGAAGDGELAVAVDAVAGVAIGRSAAGSVRDGGVVGDVEVAFAVDAVAGGSFAFAALRSPDVALDGELAAAVDAVAGVTAAVSAVAVAADGADNGGFVRNGELAVAVDAVAGVVGTIAVAALRFFDGAALDLDGNILAIATSADAVAGVATGGVLDGAALDGDCGLAGASVTAADAGTTLIGPRIDFGSAADGDIGFAGSPCTAANAGTIGGTDGGDVAACYLNGAGTTVAYFAGVPDAADASRGTAACGGQAAGVAAIFISGCDGQFAGVFSAIIVLFVVLEAGMLAVAGEGIVALERDRRVARALDAEGGVIFGLNVDIVQRHVEGVVIAFGLVDDADDIVGDVFGCAPEVFRRAFQDRSRFVPGLFVVIGVGDLEGCTGVRELAFGCREAALRAFRAFRAFGRGLAAGGGSAARRAGGAALRAFALRVRASRAGVLAAGLVLFRGISLVFLAAGSVVRLVLAFFAAGSVVRLVLVFLAAAGGRRAALGVAEVDLVFVFAVF